MELCVCVCLCVFNQYELSKHSSITNNNLSNNNISRSHSITYSPLPTLGIIPIKLINCEYNPQIIRPNDTHTQKYKNTLTHKRLHYVARHSASGRNSNLVSLLLVSLDLNLTCLIRFRFIINCLCAIIIMDIASTCDNKSWATFVSVYVMYQQRGN